MKRISWIQAGAAVALGIALAATATAAAAEAPGDYPVQIGLKLEGQGPWYRLRLPVEAMLQARDPQLNDVRVFNAEGEALPYSLLPGAATHERMRQEQAARLFPLRGPLGGPADALSRLRVVQGDKGTIVEIPQPGAPAGGREAVRGWVLDVGGGGFALERLVLDWRGGADGFQRFGIEASDDLSDWRPLGEGQIARLGFNGEQVDKRDVDLRGIQARYLRLLWLAPEEAPELTAAKVSGSRSKTQAAPLVWWQVPAQGPGQDGNFHWELPQSLPLERIRVPLAQVNSLAPVVLYRRNLATEPWAPLARGVLYRLPGSGGELRQEELELPGWPVKQLRLQADARGSGLGAQPPSISVGLRATELVFLARGNPPYRLALGKPGAESGDLPLSTLVPGFDDGKLAAMGSAALDGALSVAAPPSAMAPKAVGPDWKRIGLWGVLLLGVALLAGMALSLLRGKR